MACGSTFEPLTRYQATRNKTCSAACARALQSAQMTGRASARATPLLALICPQCGKLFQRKQHEVKGSRAFCSRSCRSRAHAAPLLANRYDATGTKRPPRYGEQNPAWKGGVTYKRPKGNYIGPRYVRCPPEFAMMARADGYVMEHRLVMAQWIGRPLPRTEVVNHINHDPRDNRRENLELYPSNGDHKRGEVGRFVDGVHNRRFLPV